MFEAPASPYLVPFDGSFRVADASTVPLTDGPDHKGKHRKYARDELNKLQRVLAARDRHAILLAFQAFAIFMVLFFRRIFIDEENRCRLC